MSKLLETAFVHLLNKENDKADELFHQFMIETARQIHEGLRQGDEAAFEGFDADDIESDHYFTEADLEDAEGTADAADGLEADMDAEVAGDEGDLGDDVAVDGDVDADLGADFDADLDADATADGDVADKVDDLADSLADMQDELDRLVADFEAAMAKGDDAFDADADTDADLADDELVKEGELSVETDDDFDEITEGVLEDLLKVSVSNDDGREQGGKSIEQNTKSLPAAKGKAAPIKIKDTPHTSFERETAPATKVEKKGRNAMSSADEAQKPASLKMPVQPNK